MNLKLLLILISFFGCKEQKTIVPKDYLKQNIEAENFCVNNNMNLDYYFLIDLSVHSGKNRFFVYNFKTKKMDFKKLVTHGSCDIFEANPNKWQKAKFSNKLDSHCSAFGKYSIGARDTSTWGIKIKYWLKGLEASNSNSTQRITVLHSWDAVADKEIFPKYSNLSWGCPAISDDFMEILDQKLQIKSKPVLLWIIEK